MDKLESEYKNKSLKLEFEYENKYEKLENENRKLHNIINRFYITINKFINWICYKFCLGNSSEIIRDFERETNTYIDPYKQIDDEQEDEEEM